MINLNLIIGVIAVYRVALVHPRGSYIVVTHITAGVQVTSDRPVTLGLVQVKLSSILSGSHAATYAATTFTTTTEVLFDEPSNGIPCINIAEY